MWGAGYYLLDSDVVDPAAFKLVMVGTWAYILCFIAPAQIRLG